MTRKLLTVCLLGTLVSLFSGCGPTPPERPILQVKGPPGISYEYTVTYINHGVKTDNGGEKTEKVETALVSGTLSAAKPSNRHQLKSGSDGIQIKFKVKEEGEASFKLMDNGAAAVRLLDAKKRLKEVSVVSTDAVIIEAGQIHAPDSWGLFLGLTVIWGMSGVCFLGLATAGIALWRTFNAHLEKAARRQARESTL